MKALVMLSGGVESTALLKYGLNNDHDLEALHVVYNNQTSYEGRYARRIAKHFNIPYSEIILQHEEYSLKHKPKVAADHAWWGAGCLIAGSLQDYDQIWFGSYLGETPPGATGPAGVNLILAAAGKHAIVKSPLYLKTKKEQWNTLPPEARKNVVSCAWQWKENTTCVEGNRKLCQKCREWSKWQIAKDV
jgi:hypothetical protein